MSIIGKRFLIVEDHEFQRSLLATVLRRMGATVVHEAAEGQAALKILANPDLPVDVVITDLEMPGMNGLEFARRIADTGVAASIILTSAHDSDRLASTVCTLRSYDIQFLGVLEKPPSVARLTCLLQSVRAPSPSSRDEPARRLG